MNAASVCRSRLRGSGLIACVALSNALPLDHPTDGHVSISLGAAATAPRDDLTPQQLIDAADGALYRAKRNGRDRVETAEL